MADREEQGREALIFLLNNSVGYGRDAIADIILASDWMQAHDAKVAAAALNTAADLWRDEGRGVMFNRDRLDLTPEGRVGKWLRDRASQRADALGSTSKVTDHG